MAWDFDGVDDYITIADDPALTTPAAGTAYSVGGWVKIPDNTGHAALKYLMSWGAQNIVPSYNLWIYGADHASFANRILWNPGATVNPSSTDPGTTTTWQHFITTRPAPSAGRELFRNGVYMGVTGTSGNIADFAGDWYIGVRNTLLASSYFKGQMAEWFKMDRALSAREMLALAAGMSPLDLPGIFDATSWYLPMYAGAYTEIKGRLALTVFGSPAPARHPPVMMPTARRQTRVLLAPPPPTFSPGWARSTHVVGGVLA